MPYANVPKAQWGKMDSCVARVMKDQKGLTKNRAIAICHKSVVGGERDISSTGIVPVAMPIRAVPGEPGRYQGYAVRFTNAGERDLYGTWFDGDTDYCLDYYAEWPWLHQHGRHSKVGARRVGTWDEFGVDDTGVFVKGELNAGERYREALEVLLSEEVLYTSSQALSSMVKVGPDGHVEIWPIGEVSSTVSPADYRGQPISAAAERAVAILSEQPTDRDGGGSMTAKDKVLKFVDQIFGEDDDEPAADADVDGDVESGEPGEGEGEETRAITVEDVVAEVAKALPLATFRDAIEAIDKTVQELAARLEAMEQHTSQTEAERVKSFASGEDWLSQLFVASRDAEPVKSDGKDAEGEVLSDGGDGKPLGDQETVWGRLNDPAA